MNVGVCVANTGTNTTTHFFRETRALALVRAQLGARPSIWCAGCSTGDEPYSLAITALEAGGTVDVLGTDVNPVALEFARRGVYAPRHLRHMVPAQCDRWFDRTGANRFCVKGEVRERVRFAPHDLTRDPAPGGGFAAVFCRNVMVYFHRAEATRAVATMAAALAPGGLLVIGASEWLPADVRMGSAAAKGLALEELDGVMVYRAAGHRSVHAVPGSAAPPEPEPLPLPEPPEPALPEPAPADATPSVSDHFVDHLRDTGDALLDKGLAEGARARYTAAITRAPLVPDLHLRLALAWLHDEHERPDVAFPSAERALRQCLFLTPVLWPAWILLSEVLAPSDPGAALAALERAAALLAAPAATTAAPTAPPLSGFLGDANAARCAVERRLAAWRRGATP